MTSDRRNTLIAISFAVGLNIRAARSRSTLCWWLRDRIAALGVLGIPLFVVALAAAAVGFFRHIVAPLRKLKERP